MQVSISIAEKIKLIRESERLTQRQMAELIGIPHGSFFQYEQGRSKPGLEATIKIFQHPQFRKYRDWFMFDEVNPEAGQVAPALAHFGQDSTTSPQSGQKSG
nr:helix-turn-helix transcriptional regulator [Serratia nevei]